MVNEILSAAIRVDGDLEATLERNFAMKFDHGLPEGAWLERFLDPLIERNTLACELVNDA